jgi:hypothetical protein
MKNLAGALAVASAVASLGTSKPQVVQAQATLNQAQATLDYPAIDTVNA